MRSQFVSHLRASQSQYAAAPVARMLLPRHCADLIVLRERLTANTTSTTDGTSRTVDAAVLAALQDAANTPALADECAAVCASFVRSSRLLYVLQRLVCRRGLFLDCCFSIVAVMLLFQRLLTPSISNRERTRQCAPL